VLLTLAARQGYALAQRATSGSFVRGGRSGDSLAGEADAPVLFLRPAACNMVCGQIVVNTHC
jgi:hypothetical protein